MNSTFVRVLSAFVAVVVVLGLYLYFQALGLMALTLLVGMGASIEYTKMALWTPDRPRTVGMTFLAASTGILAVAMLPGPLTPVMLASGLVFSTLAMMVAMSRAPVELLFSTVGRICLGLVYCAMLPSIIIWILKGPDGQLWFFTLLGVVFANDTFAYFSGMLFGRRKMWESVSPKKTWAGSYGGLLGSLVAVLIIRAYLLPHVEIWIMLVVSVVGGVLGQAGDMFESILKRTAGVKDSGRIMPGHGGFLDRVDSVLFAAPIVYLMSQIARG